MPWDVRACSRTHRRIRCYRTDTGYRARVLIRDYDGAVRAVERRGPTKTSAAGALKTALRDRAPVHASGEITADSRVSVLAEAWYAGLTDLSPVTMQAYRDRLDRQILPGLGQLRVRELSIGVFDPTSGWSPTSTASPPPEPVALFCPASAHWPHAMTPLEQHGGHTPTGVWVRVLQRVLVHTAAMWRSADGAPTPRSLIACDE